MEKENIRQENIGGSGVWKYTYDEIVKDFESQTDCIKNCIEHYFTDEMAKEFDRIIKSFGEMGIRRILFIGNTFNYYASYIPFFQLCNSNRDVNFTWQIQELSEFYYYLLPTVDSEPVKKTLYIFISNSGKSRFLLKSIEHLRLIKVPPERIWLLTGNMDTPVKSQVGLLFNTCLDRELVLGTKSFILNVLILYLISFILQGVNPINEKMKEDLQFLVHNLDEYKKYRKKITDDFVKLTRSRFSYIYYISREPASYSVAALSALSTMSFTRIFAEGTTLGLFFHGPFQIIGKEHLAIVLISQSLEDESRNLLVRLMEQIKDKVSIRNILIIRNCQPDEDYCLEFGPIFSINYKCRIEALSPLFQFNILQYLLLELAYRKGLLSSE